MIALENLINMAIVTKSNNGFNDNPAEVNASIYIYIYMDKSY